MQAHNFVLKIGWTALINQKEKNNTTSKYVTYKQSNNY